MLYAANTSACDGVGRLKTAFSPQWGTASYDYVPMGNLLEKEFTDWNGMMRTVANSYNIFTNRVE